MTPFLRRLVVLVLNSLVLSSLVVLTTLVAPAHAAATGLSGTVTDVGGLGVETCLTVFTTRGGHVDSTCTQPDGTWALPAVADGRYKIQVRGTDALVGEWAQDAQHLSTAQVVTSPGTVDVQLQPGGVLHGTLRDRDGSLASGVLVEARGPFGTAALTTTAPDGTWSLRVAPSTYRVSFNSAAVVQYAYGTESFGAATTFTVLEGDSLTIDDQLLPHGILTGVVTDEASGSPIADVCVALVDPAVSSSPVSRGVCTGTDGRYRLIAQNVGDFAVRFTDAAGRYAGEYSGETYRRSSAQVLAITSTSRLTVDAALARGGQITGLVKSATTGVRVSGGCPVVFFDRSSEDVLLTAVKCTGAQGFYRIWGIPAGAHTVQVRFAPAPGPAAYVDTWVGNTLDQTSARLLTVTTAATTKAPLTRVQPTG